MPDFMLLGLVLIITEILEREESGCVVKDKALCDVPILTRNKILGLWGMSISDRHVHPIGLGVITGGRVID